MKTIPIQGTFCWSVPVCGIQTFSATMWAFVFLQFSSSISSSSIGEKKKLKKVEQARESIKPLNGTGRQHLVTEVVLVVTDGAVPAADSLVLTDHDVLSNLIEETEIVGDDNDTTAVGIDGIGQ